MTVRTRTTFARGALALSVAAAAWLGAPCAAGADDQTKIGAGNDAAARIAKGSPLVRASLDYLSHQADRIKDRKLRDETQDAVFNDKTCIVHRAGLTAKDRDGLVQQLLDAKLVHQADGNAIVGGITAGIFPPIVDDGGKCPKLPQPFYSAPGSAFTGHHSYPGGLPVHEAFNERSDIYLADDYRRNYNGDDDDDDDEALYISKDIIRGAPIWHDWGKPMVFQWNADGSEFTELNFGGTGTNDAWGAAGDSRTGGHHIIGIAETMARGLPADFVITQASAHSAPTSGNEYKVVNWLRAAAILARIDPVKKGYLYKDGSGNLRLPPLRKLGSVDLNATSPAPLGQTNLLAEYTIHNLSDADFTFTGPSISIAVNLLALIGPDYGFKPGDKTYNTGFRNVVLAHLAAERIVIVYGNGGLDAVKGEVKALHKAGLF